MIARQDIALSAPQPLMRQIVRQRSMLLNEPDTVWIVESGTALVFATMVEGDRPVGSRRNLFRVSDGDLIASIATAQLALRTLMLFAISDLRLREMSRAELAERCQSDTKIREAVDHWLCRLAELLEQNAPPAGAERLDENTPRIELEAGRALRVAGDDWRWLVIECGAVRINGVTKMTVAANETPVPIGAGFWLQTTQSTTLRPLTDEERFATHSLTASLSWMHTLVQRRLAALDEEDAQRERMRITSRQFVQRGLVTAAMDEVRSILHPTTSLPHRETPLLSAMAVIGQTLGVEAQPPAASEDLSLVKDPIDAIARAMRIRHRRVTLTGVWWKDDCGPLLTTDRETQNPIALIKPTVGPYLAVDPTASTTQPVDATIAARLVSQATMFYRPLPASVTRPWQLLSLARQRQGLDIAFVIALSLVTTLLGFLTPIATGRLMDLAIPDANARLVVELGLGLAAAAGGIALLQIAQAVLAVRIAVRAETTLEAGVWDRLLRLRPRFFSRFSTGDLLMRASAITQISREINGVTMRSLLTSLMGLLNLALLFYYSAKLAMIAMVLVIIVALVTGICGGLVGSYARQLMQLRGRIFGMVVQIVCGVSKLRVAQAQERAFAVWMRRYAEQVRLIFRAHRAQDVLAVFNHVLPTISSVALFWFAASMLLVEEGSTVQSLTIGAFLAFNTAMGVFIGSATELSLTLVGLVDTLINSRRLAPILAAEPEVRHEAADPGRLTGHISLSRVHFRYHPDGPKILDGIDLVAEPGQFIALTGPSGCGKSTILRLLLGFETPESGVIAYDGQDLAGLDVTAVRRQIGVVLQSSRINTGSIFDNISGGLAVSMEEAWEAAEDAGLADDIRDMPMGMHTMISEGGGNISGGQRQRLFIARALVKQPRILLLDEATSALDNRTQQIVSRSLARRNVTRIVIAHRLSTIRDADRIYILEHGRIVDQGTYDQLKRTHELFVMAA